MREINISFSSQIDLSVKVEVTKKRTKQTRQTSLKKSFTMNKLLRNRYLLLVCQLISITVATIVLIVYYNPWIEQIIDEAERSGNAGQSFANQIIRTDYEEIMIILTCVATIVVSVIGLMGTLRGIPHDGGGHSHCLLNFYSSTLIIFLFVIFIALLARLWQIYGKLHQAFQLSQTSTSAQNETSIIYQFDFGGPQSTTITPTTVLTFANNRTRGRHHPSSSMAPVPATNINDAASTTWWCICKSLVYITLAGGLFATALRLTRRILESLDDRYLSANDDADDLNSEASSNAYVNNNNRTFGWGLSGVLAPSHGVHCGSSGIGLYNSASLGKSLDGSSSNHSGCESARNPFRHI